MIIIVKALVLSGSIAGVLTYINAHRYHHSSVCHRCGGKGYYNGGICPDCQGSGKYVAGKDPHEHHYDFKKDDEAIDTESDSCDTSDRQFNA